jgi:hypothetical protein
LRDDDDSANKTGWVTWGRLTRCVCEKNDKYGAQNNRAT